MKNTETRYARLPCGPVSVTWQDGRVSRVELRPRRGGRPDQSLAFKLMKVLKGGRTPSDLHVDVSGLSRFARQVLGLCAGIRPGRVMTYAELARKAGRPGAARAVGQVMARNRFPLLIPCHRVVGSDRRLTGFGGGLPMKRALLAAEGWNVDPAGRVSR